MNEEDREGKLRQRGRASSTFDVCPQTYLVSKRERPRSLYWILVKEDRDMQRWYDNVCRGSKITADLYLRRLGFICNSKGISPSQLVQQAKSDGRWAYNFLMDLVTELEREGKTGSYTEANVKVVKSWLSHNGIQVVGRIKIKGASDTPTLRDKGALTSSEQAMLFSTASTQTRCASVLILEAGLRPETIGNYEGTDGLTVGDLPEMKVEHDDEVQHDLKVSFVKIPSMIVVRRELSKARHQYFTFLPGEGCQFIAEYLKERAKQGERIDASSPLVTPGQANSWQRKNRFVRTTLLGRIIRNRLLHCKINARPYDLRVTFATRLMLAESRGLMIRDYRVFFMGHKGDIEARYTTNKNTLPIDVIEDMRSSFARAQKYLESEGIASDEKDLRYELRKQLLLAAGFSEEEAAKMEIASMTNEAVHTAIRTKLLGIMASNGSKQKVVQLNEVEEYISNGWEFVAALANDRAVVRVPF